MVAQDLRPSSPINVQGLFHIKGSKHCPSARSWEKDWIKEGLWSQPRGREDSQGLEVDPSHPAAFLSADAAIVQPVD